MTQSRNKKLFLLGLFLGLFFGGLLLTGAVVGAQSIADPSSTLNQGVQMIQEPLGLPGTDIRTIVARIIRVFLGLLGVIAVVLMIYAGFLWMTAGGNEEKIAQSKKILTNATIGLVIILSAYAIVSFVITRLLSATTGYPQHCFDGILNEGETNKDCGGECPACPTVCTDPPCGFSNVFFVQQLPPTPLNVCVRNVKIAVMFSEAVDISTLNENTVTIKKQSDNSAVSGSWQLGSDRNVALWSPNGSCSPNETGANDHSDCLAATTTYILDIDNGVAEDRDNGIKNASGSRILNCSLKAKCDPVVFTTGEGVDRNSPTVSLDVISPFQSGLVMQAKIHFTDDNGLQNVSLYAGYYFIGSETLSGCQKSGTTTIDWATAGMMGNYETRGVGLDWAGNRAEDKKTVTLRPEHCFNHVQDIIDNETGVDCGGACGACEGGKCTDNTQCASGYCEIIPPATEGVCIDRMKITDVSPLSGASSTFVTIAGNYFGTNVGKVYFAKVANPDKNNLNDWQRALLANCGASSKVWVPWQIIVEVPIANAISGPIMVETASSTGKDGVVRKFFDTTNDDWGKKFSDFLINNQARPGLCPIDPDNGVPNDARNLFGKNFGTAGGQIFFGSQQAARINWVDAQISAKVPFLDKGSLGVYVKPMDKLESNSVYFYINGTVGKDDPVISEISPNHGAKGEYITITGDKFGNTQGVVWFRKDATLPGDNSFPAACAGATWTDKQIIIKAPSSTSATFGDYFVWISTGDAVPRVSTKVAFKLESGAPAPGICRIDPENGPIPFAAGGNMKVHGEYFVVDNVVSKNCKYGNKVCAQNSDCPKTYNLPFDNPDQVYAFAKSGFCWKTSQYPPGYGSNYRECNSDTECQSGEVCNKSLTIVPGWVGPVNTCEVSSASSATSAVYFWRSDASPTTTDRRVVATEVSSVLPNLITLRPPVTTQTGPVAAYRASDNKLGNGIAFTVNDCVKNKGCTGSGTHCCVSGADQGICRPDGELCAGETRSTGYVWRFSTRDIPAPLTVVEKCDESTEAGQALPTPSPSTIWNRSGFPNDDHSNVCRSALVEIEFSRGDVSPLGTDDLRVSECVTTSLDVASRFCVPGTPVPVKDQDDHLTNFVPTVSSQMGANASHDYLELKPQDGYNFGKWKDNTWYRVVLRGNISAGVGTSTFVNLSNTRPCDIDGNLSTDDKAAYCFLFKTGEEECRLRAVVITPYSYWTNFLEAPLKEHSVGGDISDLFYAGHGLSEQRCIMMDVSGFNWQWSAANPPDTDYADIYSNGNAINGVQVSSLQNTVGVNLINPNNAVNIDALVSTGTEPNIRYYPPGHSPLTIDLSNPQVMDYWPNCLEACTDAEIGVRFNLTMSNSNLSHVLGGPVQLSKCLDENCLSTELVALTSLALDPVSGYSVLKINPSTVLEKHTIYQVVLSNEYDPAPDRPVTHSDVLWSASRYNDPTSFSKPMNSRFVWRFRTKKEACKIDRVEVLPKVFNAPNLTAKTIYSAQPYSAPDACSATGQKLNAANANWDWSSSATDVATTTEFISKGYNPFCTAGCVRKGSDVPAGVFDRNLRVCGNGIVEAGEDCDPGTAASPVGPSAVLGCGLNCLRMGNNDVTTSTGADLGKCGDGFVSLTKGEECDPNSNATSTRINCTNNCLHTGSKLSTGASDISASICGNSYIGVGEDCDLGIDASSTNPLSSAGCSANCLHQGTRLSTKWCNDHKVDMGGFTTSSYHTFCDQAYSQCGDGVENPDEDPGCDTGAGWLANGCNEFCLLRQGDYANSTDPANDVVASNDCNTVGTGGCNSQKQHVGSSLLYSTPSICGDRVAGLGEDAWCETSLTIVKTNEFVNPWALATGVGRGTPTGEPLAQRANIIAETRTDTSGGVVKSSFGQFLIKCGFQNDEECRIANGGDTKYGVAANSCCFVRPQLTEVYPGVTTTNETGATPNEAIDTCPNTYISANFDQMVDERSLSGNFIIARGNAAASCGNGEEDVTELVAMNNNGLNSASVKWYVSLWRHVVYFFKNLMGSDAQAIATGVNVQTWCAGQDVGTAEVVPDTYGSGSKIKVNLKKPLAFNVDYIVILGPEIKDVRGVKIGQVSGKNIFWRFSTGGKICEVYQVTVAPSQYYFSTAGSTTTLEAEAWNDTKQQIQSIPGFYAWETLWAPQTNNFVGLVNTTSSLNIATAKNQNGEIDIRASANITDNKYTDRVGLVATGRTHLIVFLCENPWPPKDLVISGVHNIIFPYEDKVGNNDGYSIASNTFTGLPIVASPVGDYFNFATYYCADNGNLGTYDDLPYLRSAVQVSANLVSASSSLKRFLFTNDRNADAIGVQVFPNTEHLTAKQWFMNSKEFGGQGFVGNLQSLKINGYDAVSDGNNIYVDGLDLSSLDPNPTSGNLFTNIYLFSINADAKPETKNVYDQIIKNLRFNTNLTNYGYCGQTMANPGSTTTCYTDFDCSNGEVCSVQTDKLKRDYTRVRDLSSIEKMLSGYYSKNRSYPDLKEGTYLSGQTLSTWPSWSVLGNAIGASLASDPVNILAPSGSCSSSTNRYCLADNNCPTGEDCVLHDATTGWSTADRRFSFACNSSSLAYRYIFSSTTGYKVYSKFEDTGLQIANSNAFLTYFISSTTHFSIFDQYQNGICLNGETITTMQSGRCGDGKLNLNLGEACDPPGYKLYHTGCTGGLQTLDICGANCQWKTPASTTPCGIFSKCGNGKVEFDETCDDGVLNGRYNHCNLDCKGWGSNGFCGDGDLQSQYEVCDSKNGKCEFTGVNILQPAQTPPPGQEPIIYFLVDLSGSMDSAFGGGFATKKINYVKAKLPDVADLLDGKAKIGVAEFSTKIPNNVISSLDIGFYDGDTVSSSIQNFDEIVDKSGSTPTGPAISWVENEVYNKLVGADKLRPFALVLLTDGDADDVPAATNAIASLRNKGVLTYVFGVAHASTNFDTWAQAGGTENYTLINDPNLNLNVIINGIYNNGLCRTYSFFQGRSCKYDCSGFGGYCGDGHVDSANGEQCEADQVCGVGGQSGKKKCDSCLKKDGLAIGKWLFNEAYNLGDKNRFIPELGNLYVLCNSANCPSLGSGKSGESLSFNGSNTFAYTQSNAKLDSNKFSVSVWIKPTGDNTAHARVVEKGGINGGTGFGLEYRPIVPFVGGVTTTKMRFVTWHNILSWSPADSVHDIPVDTWTHVVGTYDGDSKTAKIYVNGVLDNATTTIASMTTSTRGITIGRSALESEGNYFNGNIDELAFYDRALSATEVKDLYDTNWLCVASVVSTPSVSATKAICGDKNIDELNDKGIKEECDNGKALNGVACQNAYNKSCSYCSADCSAVIFREATGYCGDGIINPNSPEVCDTDPTSIIFSKSYIFGKTSEVSSSVHLGYQVSSCLDEKNFKLNQITIATTSDWAILLLDVATNKGKMQNILNSLKTYREGIKTCVSDCKELREDCTDCGLSASGSEIKGALVNVLEPNTVATSKYRTPAYFDVANNWEQDTVELFYVDHLSSNPTLRDYAVARQEVSVAVGDPNFTFNEFVLKPHGSVTTDPETAPAIVNTNPMCSATTTNNHDYRYQLDFNASRQDKQAVLLNVISSPAPWQYDQILSPVIRLNSYSKSPVTIDARPQDIRIVVRWIDDRDVFSGFMIPAAPNTLLEDNSFTEVTGVNYYNYNAEKKSSVWYHGFSSVASKTSVEAFTVDTEHMTTDTYAFYVHTSEEYNMKNFIGSHLQVEVYIPENETFNHDNSWRHFSRPVAIYRLNDAIQSDNAKARYWHVFNIKKTTSGDASLNNIEDKFTINDPNSPVNGQEVQISRVRTSELQMYYSY